LKGNVLQITDLDSRNGTEVNGRRLKAFTPCTLQDKDIVDFGGRLSFRVHLADGQGLAVLQVEPDESASTNNSASGGFLRTHRLPEQAAPDLKPERWQALCDLSIKLGSAALQRKADTWLQTLCDEGAALLGMSQLQLLRLIDGRPTRVYPLQRACRVRGEAIEELLRGGAKTVGLELLSNDLDHLDLQETFDTPAMVSGPQVVTLLLGTLWVESQPWGVLYATNELSNRRRTLDEQDLWASQRLCGLVSGALSGVMWWQTLELERAAYARLQSEALRVGLVGVSASLGAALESTLTVCDDNHPVFLQAEPGTEPHVWAQLIHGLRQRRGVLKRLSLDDGPPPTSSSPTRPPQPPLLERLRAVLAACQEGTLLLDDLDMLGPGDAQVLQQAWSQGWFVATSLVCSAPLSPRQLGLQQSLSAAMLSVLTSHVVRVPALAERSFDMSVILERCAALVDPLGHPNPLTTEAAMRAAQIAFPGDMAQMRAELTALLTQTSMRPILPDDILALWPTDITLRLRPDKTGTTQPSNRMTLKVESLPAGVSPMLLPALPANAPAIPLSKLAQNLRRIGFP
jgi:hypothetical protein